MGKVSMATLVIGALFFARATESWADSFQSFLVCRDETAARSYSIRLSLQDVFALLKSQIEHKPFSTDSAMFGILKDGDEPRRHEVIQTGARFSVTPESAELTSKTYLSHFEIKHVLSRVRDNEWKIVIYETDLEEIGPPGPPSYESKLNCEKEK